MLSPNSITKGKAPSIFSVDSGYGSNTCDEDELSQHPTTIETVPAQRIKEPIGLGISDLWDVLTDNQRQSHRMEVPIEPVTTKLHVFPVRAVMKHDLPPVGTGENSNRCISCQLWTFTNPGEGSKCDMCRSHSEVRHDAGSTSNVKPVAPSLDIPRESRPEDSSQYSRTRCLACELARSTGLSTCSSCTPDPDLLSPISPGDVIRRSCAKRPAKLPSHALDRLQAWLKANHHDPYPDAETKRILANECGISEKQVNTWFTNTRARKLALSPENSYPSSDDEGLCDSAFSSRANTPICTSGPTLTYGLQEGATSGLPALDQASLSPQTSRRGKKKDYRRLNTVSPIERSPVPPTPATPSPNPDGSEQIMWQCTFCLQSLVPKSWRRHEETQHRPKYQWICLATGPRLTISSGTDTSTICAFCQMENPDENHILHSHRILECSKKYEADRTFGRPDHLRQHVKNFHKCSLLEHVRDTWRRDRPGKKVDEGWKCGFCGEDLKTWDIRETHIANHFKDGLTIAAWTEHPPPSYEGSDDSDQSWQDEQSGMFCGPHQTFNGQVGEPQPGQQQQPLTAPSQSVYEMTFQPLTNITTYPTNTAPLTLPHLVDTAFETCNPDPFSMDYAFAGMSAPNDLDTMFPSPLHAYEDFADGSNQLQHDAFANVDMYGNVVDYWNGQQQ